MQAAGGRALLCWLLCCAVAVANADSRSPVTALPGFGGPIAFQQWTGYVDVRPSVGRHRFYWFVESQNQPQADPVVLWLTGGPGCSSLFALFTEHGPWKVQPDGCHLYANPYSWNKVANVIYVESPCGVGFSYADDGNYTTGDNDAAMDNYAFVLGWMKLFPEFSSNPFFIAGESYAGHYVPQLAQKIFEGQQKGENSVALQGFMAGNPSTYWENDAQGYFPFMAGHMLIGSEVYEWAYQACSGNFVDPPSQACEKAIQFMRQSINKINPYDIYAPCDGPWSPNGGCFTDQWLTASRGMSPKFRPDMSTLSTRGIVRVTGGGQTVIPCMNESATEAYLQRSDVHQALNIVSQSLKYPWTACSQNLNYTQYAPTVLPIYTQLSPHMRIMVYSGDVDSCVPVYGTQKNVDSLDLPMYEQYRAWFVDGQVAGYVKVYINSFEKSPSLSFATVKDAGHMVPQFQPPAALTLFECFIKATDLPHS